MYQSQRRGVRRTSFRSARVWIVGILALLLWAVEKQAMAQQPYLSSTGGEELFETKCTACHTIGQGDKVGPDLKGVTGRRDRGWLTQWLLAPDQMIGKKDPVAMELLKQFKNIPMPNQKLSERDVASLLNFLAAQSAPAELKKPERAETLPKGDIAIGKSLFIGVKRFESGGPPCLACHAVSGMGALGGGALGPDLTDTYSKLGALIITWPETVDPMRMIYSIRQLTQEENAHLASFLQSASLTRRPTSAVGLLVALGAAGAACMILLSHLVWHGRLKGVRRSIVTSRPIR